MEIEETRGYEGANVSDRKFEKEGENRVETFTQHASNFRAGSNGSRAVCNYYS